MRFLINIFDWIKYTVLINCINEKEQINESAYIISIDNCDRIESSTETINIVIIAMTDLTTQTNLTNFDAEILNMRMLTDFSAQILDITIKLILMK